MDHKVIILSFALTLSAALSIIDGYEVLVFVILYSAHMIGALLIKKPVKIEDFTLMTTEQLLKKRRSTTGFANSGYAQ